MKLSDLLSSYRTEVRRSKRWRTNEGYDADWKRFIDLYKGKHYEKVDGGEQLIVNMVFSTINTMAPAVAVNNPKFTVSARKPDHGPNAVVAEEVLNYQWRTNQFQPEFRLAVNDWLVVGHGWTKVGWKFVKPPEEKKVDDGGAQPNSIDGVDEVGIDDREDIDGNVESEQYVYEDRPFLERISIFDMFVDPDARKPSEMCWIAQRVWRPVNDVKVDNRYSATARRAVAGQAWSRWDSDGNSDARDDTPDRSKQFVEVIEFYDIKRRTVCTFALNADDASTNGQNASFLIKPKPMPYGQGHPFVMLRNYEITDHFYPMGDVEQIESLQLELNATRSQMMMHRKRFNRKWLYRKDDFERDGIAALESDIDNTMVPVQTDGPLSESVVPMPAVITPSDFYNQSQIIIGDIDRVSGVSDYMRGGNQTMKRTATEAAMIQDSSNSRAQDRLTKIESVLSVIGGKVIGLMQQFMTGDQVARIVTLPGAAWVNYDKDYIAGDFDFSVQAGSTEPMNESFRRQRAMQLSDVSAPFVQMGVANPVGIYQYLLQNGFGVQDTSQFITPPAPPQVDPASGQPQGVAPPPGAGQVPPIGGPPIPPGGPPMGPDSGAPPQLSVVGS